MIAINKLSAEKTQLPRVVIIGAGISGLTAAYKLKQSMQSSQQPAEVLVLESSSSPGGVIRTRKNEYGLIEEGPEAFVTHKPAALELVRELQMEDKLLACSRAAARTFVSSRGELEALPDGFIMFAPTRLAPLATSKLFSIGGKLRMALDLILPACESEEDESLAHFVRRRLGQEALDRLAEPLIAGIYSTDPEDLSACCAVPQLRALERKYGSVILGLAAGKRKATSPAAGGLPTFLTFTEGMQTIVDELARKLGDETLLPDTAVSQVVPGLERQWRVVCRNGRQIEADAMIICTPASTAAAILSEVLPQTATQLRSISYGTSSMLSLVFRREDIGHALNGSGFVVPAVERRFVSACSFSSIKFGDRVKDDFVLLRTFTRRLMDAASPDYLSEFVASVMPDLRDLLQVRGRPVFAQASAGGLLPQYRVGHKEKVQLIMSGIRNCPGVFLAGNSYEGVGIPDCIKSATEAAGAAFAYLEHMQAYAAAGRAR